MTRAIPMRRETSDKKASSFIHPQWYDIYNWVRKPFVTEKRPPYYDFLTVEERIQFDHDRRHPIVIEDPVVEEPKVENIYPAKMLVSETKIAPVKERIDFGSLSDLEYFLHRTPVRDTKFTCTLDVKGQPDTYTVTGVTGYDSYWMISKPFADGQMWAKKIHPVERGLM